MALSTRDVLVVIRARDVASRVVRQVGTSFNRAGDDAARMGQRLMNVGAALTGVGIGLSVLGASGVAFMATLARETAEYNQLAQRTRTQVDDLSISTRDLAMVARNIALEIPKPAEELQRTLYFIFSTMDVNLREAEHLLRAFARESVASMGEIEAAARSTIAILNAFQLPVSEVTRITDLQFQVIRKGAITYDELSKVIGLSIAPTVRAGQEVETLGAMLAFLTKQGLTASRASTSSARALESFAHPRTVSRLEDMGFAVRDSAGEFLPLVDVIRQMSRSMENMPGPERAETLFNLFRGGAGRIQARRFWDLAVQNFDEFEKMVGFMENKEGVFERAYGEMFEQPISKMQLMTNAWQELRYVLGDQVLPIITPLIERFTTFLHKVANMEEETVRSRVALVAWASAIAIVTGVVLTFAGALAMLEGTMTLAFGRGPIQAVVQGTRTMATAIGVMGLQFATIMRNSVAASGLMVGSIKGLTTAFVASFRAMGNALLAFSMKHPILLAVTAIVGALGWAYFEATKRSREIKDATAEYTTALAEQERALAGGMTAVSNYREAMADSQRQTVINRLEEAGLLKQIEEVTSFRKSEFVQGILNENRMRDTVIDGLRAEQKAMQAAAEEGVHRVRGQAQISREDSKRLSQLSALIRQYEIEAEAIDASREAMLQRLAAQGGVNEMIVKYIRASERGTRQSEIVAKGLELEIKRHLEMAIAQGELTEETEALAEAYGLLPDNMAEAAAEVEQLNEFAQSLQTSLKSILAPTRAWSEALAKVNEDLDDNVDTLRGVEGGMDMWIEALQNGEQTTNDMFGNIVTIIDRGVNEIGEHTGDAVEAILAMGDAGPDAMAMLAESDPEQFIEALRLIRLQAAMTSEDVVGQMGELINNMDLLMLENRNMPAQHMQAMLESSILVVQQWGGDIEGEMGNIMSATADVIGSYEDLTAQQIQMVMEAIVDEMMTGGSLASNNFLDALRSGEGDITEIFERYQRAIDRAARRLRMPKLPPMAAGDNLALNRGGLVPGRGANRDTVLAALTQGEFVMRRGAVDKIGAGVLARLNQTGDLQSVFNQGGLVGDRNREPAFTPAGSAGSTQYHFHLHGEPGQSQEDMFKDFIEEVAWKINSGGLN